MKKLLLLAVAALISNVAFAVEKQTDRVYVLVNKAGKRLITNVKPFPDGYAVLTSYPSKTGEAMPAPKVTPDNIRK